MKTPEYTFFQWCPLPSISLKMNTILTFSCLSRHYLFRDCSKYTPMVPTKGNTSCGNTFRKTPTSSKILLSSTFAVSVPGHQSLDGSAVKNGPQPAATAGRLQNVPKGKEMFPRSCCLCDRQFLMWKRFCALFNRKCYLA